jgi:hypothetical protein
MGCFGQQHMLHDALVQPLVAARILLPAAVLLLGQFTLREHLASTPPSPSLLRVHCTARIGQIFALARYGGLEQLAAEPADKARGLDEEANHCVRMLSRSRRLWPEVGISSSP